MDLTNKTMNTSNNLIEKAISTATKLHAGQKRKGSGDIPYIAHPIEVALITSHYSSTPEYIVAALLHDTVEDCDYTLTELEADLVLKCDELVEALSENKSIEKWSERKIENIERLKTKHGCLLYQSG